MSNVEHLIENALTAMSKKPSDTYQAFVEEMSAMYNQRMLQEVSITEAELWEIAQYLIYVWLPTIDPEDLRPKGRWIEKTGRSECSVCYDECWADSAATYNYCPNCGAKMEVT